MEQVFIYTILVLSGAILGSFAGAQVWRTRARQLAEDKKNKEKVNNKEYKRLLPLTKKGKCRRSIDLDTGKQLPWYDLIPVVSWLALRGKSRFSGKPIGWLEPLFEFSMISFFVLSYAFWPYELHNLLAIIQFVLWLAAGVGLAILFAYDFKWSLLPNRPIIITLVIAVSSAIFSVLQTKNIWASLLSLAGAILILSGLYCLLYILSKGRWVGFGDTKLGLILALLLTDWSLAFVALFAANLIGCLIVLPNMIAGKMTPKTRIPFGPLLITGAVIAQFFGYQLVNWYANGLF
jgi:prepilin signal peptidase PulO-like enzyme (type II secretory pathway)